MEQGGVKEFRNVGAAVTVFCISFQRMLKDGVDRSIFFQAVEGVAEREFLVGLKTLVTADGIMSPEELVAKLDELGADGVDANGQIEIGAGWIDAVHRAGKIFAVWTIDNPWQAERFISLGVDSITSNRAAMLRDLLKQED